MKPTIEIRWRNGQWEARSDDPHQGSVSATDEIVLKVVAEWMASESVPDALLRDQAAMLRGRCA